MSLLFAAALFVSAFLLFWVQPLVGKMVLPLLGGTPAVWNTCMLFFQALLLAGYAYALALDALALGARAGVVHVGLLVVAAFALPPAIWMRRPRRRARGREPRVVAPEDAARDGRAALLRALGQRAALAALVLAHARRLGRQTPTSSTRRATPGASSRSSASPSFWSRA